MKKLHIDIETYSSVDLPKTGVYRYAASPDFLILMACWTDDGENYHVAFTREEIEAIPGLRDPNVLKVAHNAQFERVCFSAFFGLPVGEYLPVEEWHDTQAVAGEMGYPQSLKALALALGGEQKDEAGTSLINIFCKPNRRGTRTLPEEKPDEWMDFIAYCRQDVVTLVDVDRKLGDFPTETERQVFFADQRVNDLGIAIDVSMAQKAYAAATENAESQKARIREISGIDNPGSVQQMGGWLREQGIKIPNLRAETVDQLLSTDLTPNQREVLELRQELALAASKKYASALAAVLPDGRLRGTLKFFGAHTARWAGRGTQIQNLPRLSFKTDTEVNAAILDLELGLGASAKTLKKLVRPLFVGPFTVVDYAAIEARVIAWLGEEEWALQAFRDGRDIYVETAERMSTPDHPLDRAQGKVAVLALGYAGGIGSLSHMGAEGTDDELQILVNQWRKSNPHIVRLWGMLENRFRSGGQVGPFLSVETQGKDRFLRLPSGRAICYRKCSIARDHLGRERLTFASPQGYRADTYGGRLAENATQAVARDVMAEAIVRLQKRGYRVVGHVHDEILVEGEHDVETISSIMCEPPEWATGLPINGEGFHCERYKKG